MRLRGARRAERSRPRPALNELIYCDTELAHMLRKRGLSKRRIAVYLNEPKRPRMRPLPKRARPLIPYTKRPTFDLRDEPGRWRHKLVRRIS